MKHVYLVVTVEAIEEQRMWAVFSSKRDAENFKRELDKNFPPRYSKYYSNTRPTDYHYIQEIPLDPKGREVDTHKHLGWWWFNIYE